MTEKELREIKRRFKSGRSNISKIVGCFVNTNKQIISRISQTVRDGDDIVSEKLLAAMKKALSGSLGTSLTEISFSTRQVTESKEHALLMRLRSSELSDTEALEELYAKIIESVSLEKNYVILLANDIYDVYERHSDGELGDSSERFSYVVCAVCPINNTPDALTFKESDSLFHPLGDSYVLSSCEVGFMFPAFDDRKTNIYGALYYTRGKEENYPALVESIFDCEAKMPPKQQMTTFNDCLAEALGEDLTPKVVNALQLEIGEMIENHKASHEEEPLVITKATVESVLAAADVDAEKIERLANTLDENFGVSAALTPKNVINTTKYELKLPDVTVKVKPDRRDLVSFEVIDGVKYVMIRATEGVEINGINVNISEE